MSSNIQDKIAEYIDRVLNGNTSNCKSVGKGISEIRINYQKEYRVYYTVLLLLAGGSKSGNQKVQQKDVMLAIEIRDYLKEMEEI